MTSRGPTMMVSISRLAGLGLIAYSVYCLLNENYIYMAVAAAMGGMLYGNAASRKLKGTERVIFFIVIGIALGLTVLGIVLRMARG